jgi:hypothetical protein
MLDQCHDARVNESAWDQIESRVLLPRDLYAKLLVRQPDSTCCAPDHRTHPRYDLLAKVIVHYGQTKLGCYVSDLSRNGVRVFSPIEITPPELIVIAVANRVAMRYEITRCRFIDRSCYECGGRLLRKN